jgi:hypothetical protein
MTLIQFDGAELLDTIRAAGASVRDGALVQKTTLADTARLLRPPWPVTAKLNGE